MLVDVVLVVVLVDVVVVVVVLNVAIERVLVYCFFLCCLMLRVVRIIFKPPVTGVRVPPPSPILSPKLTYRPHGVQPRVEGPHPLAAPAGACIHSPLGPDQIGHVDRQAEHPQKQRRDLTPSPVHRAFVSGCEGPRHCGIA